MAVQYLESLDSVRGSRRRSAEGGDTRLAELQAYLEVLLTLALGRDVVVPQSIAFDSWTFLKVAEQVINARDHGARESDETPLHLHLHNASSFDDAMRKMLGRMRSTGSFHSSLLPEWSDEAPDRRTELAGDLDEFVRWTPREVRRRLKLVRAEFADSPPVGARPRAGAPSLEDAVAAFLHPVDGTDAVAEGLDDDGLRSTYVRLTDAMAVLYAESRESFRQRSLLRTDRPWSGADTGPSADDLVPGAGDLDLVVEFVDTVYNRVLVDSIGVAPATYTTSVHVGADLPLARQLAQRLALDPEAVGRVRPTEGSAAPLFEVRTDPAALASSKRLDREISTLLDKGYEGLVPLFQARSAGRESAGSNDFWTGVQAIEDAARRRDADELAERQRAHMRYVASVLGGGPRLPSSKETGAVMFSTASTGGLAEVVMSSGLFDVIVTSAGAAAGGALLVAGQAGRRRWRRDRFASALGDFVTVEVAPS